MVVDDIESNRKLVKNTLETKGLQIIEAIEGAQAIMLAKQILPDLILMDICMPGMGGVEATKKIKEEEQFKNTPIIALTASEKQEAVDGVFDLFLTKPISPNQLVGHLQNFLQFEIQALEHEEDPWQFKQEELLKIMDPSMQTLMKKAITSGMFDDIEFFAKKLKEMAQQNNYELLVQYADHLEEAVENFDVKQLQEMLEFLEQTLENNSQ